MTNPLPGGSEFVFGVYSSTEVGLTTLKESALRFIVDCYIWPLPLDVSGLGTPTRSLSSHQHSSPGHNKAYKPHDDKVAVLKEGKNP